MDLVNCHIAISTLDGGSDMYPSIIGQFGSEGLKFSSCICADMQGTHVLIPQPVKAQHLHHHFHPATSLAKAKDRHIRT
jgi:hypothetical protein